MPVMRNMLDGEIPILRKFVLIIIKRTRALTTPVFPACIDADRCTQSLFSTKKRRNVWSAARYWGACGTSPAKLSLSVHPCSGTQRLSIPHTKSWDIILVSRSLMWLSRGVTVLLPPEVTGEKGWGFAAFEQLILNV